MARYPSVFGPSWKMLEHAVASPAPGFGKSGGSRQLPRFTTSGGDTGLPLQLLVVNLSNVTVPVGVGSVGSFEFFLETFAQSRTSTVVSPFRSMWLSVIRHAVTSQSPVPLSSTWKMSVTTSDSSLPTVSGSHSLGGVGLV